MSKLFFFNYFYSKCPFSCYFVQNIDPWSRRPVSEFVYNLVIAAVLVFDIVNIKVWLKILTNLGLFD